MSTDAGQHHTDVVPPSTARGTPAGTPQTEVVTSVIHHQVKAGAEASYEAWVREITPAAQRFPGHLGVDILQPPQGAGLYTIVLRFDTLEHLQGWLASDTRQGLIAQVEPLLVHGGQVDIKTGLEFWFTPPHPGQQHPPPYKQFLLTLSVIFPLTLLVPWALQPLFQAMPSIGLPGVRHFASAAVIVGLMTYVIMPHYTRLVADWLYRPSKESSTSRQLWRARLQRLRAGWRRSPGRR
jgi:antibiotic biosynthesis monooxygenase (ABM) superfamily enzyme